jgi:hypothetical protein
MPASGDVLLDTSVSPRWRWNINCRWLLAMLILTWSLGWQC